METQRRKPSAVVWQKTVPRVKELLCVEFFEQGSSAWLAQRNQMLTASDVAAALGLNPYQSVKTLLEKKAFPEYKRRLDKRNDTAATRWGHLYEDEARRLYENKTGHFVYEFGVIPHRDLPWLGGSPDGITASGRLLEIKVGNGILA